MLLGDSSVTKFSFLEYQAIVLCLAGTICLGMMAIEVSMSRFQVLPLLLPGVFSIRERRFFFYDIDVTNGALAAKLRSHAKMLARMTLCLVLSYLWQQCVIRTETRVGVKFPHQQCEDNLDCFASEVHFMTLLQRSYEAVDCRGDRKDFDDRVVVSCIGFVKPRVSAVLMHVGIAHSLTQLNFKFYGLMVWVAGNSKWLNRLFGALALVTFCAIMGLFFSGALSEFTSSWLSFVTTLSVPGFLFTVNRSAKLLQHLRRLESEKMQWSIDQHLSSALADMEHNHNLEEEHPTEENKINLKNIARVREAFSSMRNRTFGAVTGITNLLPDIPRIRGSGNSGDHAGVEDEVPDKQ